MFCSCVQKYDLISVRCRVDTAEGPPPPAIVTAVCRVIPSYGATIDRHY